LARKILLADDSVTAQNMGRKILADAGYDVVTVNNGSAALKRVAEIKPDLIVLDVYMPGYSGLEVCQRLKDAADTAHIPVLLTVGKLEPFKAEEGRRVRADNHIVKPFEASELLTAITRLEERIVPQQSNGGERFASKASRATETNPEVDTGWKSRLSFASKKKKDEKESTTEDFAAGASFRDFRKAKGKPAASGSLAAKAPLSLEQEADLAAGVTREVTREVSTDGARDVTREIPRDVARLVPQDVPGDITPEELDALSALASRLGPSFPQTESAAVETTTEQSEPEERVFSVATEPPAMEVVAQNEYVAQNFESAAPADSAPPYAEVSPDVAVEAANEREPIQYAEAPPEFSTLHAGFAVTETSDHEPPHFETPQPEAGFQDDPSVATVVDTASLAEQPAPVDQEDEPTFASFVNVIEPAAGQWEQKVEEQPAEAVATSQPTEVSASEEADTATCQEAQPEELTAQSTEQSESTVASDPESTEAQDQDEDEVPSDAELVEALRLLTPSLNNVEFSTPPNEKLVAAGQLLAEEAMRHAAAGPRWVAEPIMLSPEEAALSLEAEMLLAFAATPAVTSRSDDHRGEVTRGEFSSVSAIAAAVENRLANLPEDARVSAQPDMECNSVADVSVEPALETSAREVSSIEPATEVMSASSTPSNPAGDENIEHVESAPEEAPKAMAAAAAEGSTFASATDASTIASIVDSVMADLRPKIVEEIARKLAGK
jgi:CheY-like chemotaxis protein